MSSSPAAPGASTASLPDLHRPVRKMPHQAVTVTATAARVEHAQYRDRAGQPDRRRTYPAAYCAGLTTAAEPPPRRTGSAAATTRPSGRNSTPVAAPISAIVENVWPNAISSADLGEAKNAGSATTVAVLRWLARGGRDGLRQRHTEVDPVEQDLEHGRDDHRAAGRTGAPGTACRG